MLKELSDRFWKLESEMSLFDKAWGDVKYWHLVRFTVFSALCEQGGYSGTAHQKIGARPFRDKASMLWNALRRSIRHSPNKGGARELMFVGHPRRKLLDGQWYDIYIDTFLDAYQMDHYFLEHAYMGGHSVPARTPDVRYFDLQDFYIKFRHGRQKAEAPAQVRKDIEALRERLKAEFGMDMDLLQSIGAQVAMFNAYVKSYGRILDRVRPKALVLVVSYYTNAFALVFAAKKRGIPVVELQHGTIYKYHMGYSYPWAKPDPAYMPDHYFLFGDFWKKHVPFPVPSGRAHVLGYPYFSLRAARAMSKPMAAQERHLLFISQGTIGKELSLFAVEFARKFGARLRIKYKLHGGEYAQWQARYPHLVGHEHIEVIDNDREDLYALLLAAEATVGVYSTVLYEALGMGKQIFMVDLPGIDSMEEIVSENCDWIVDHPEQIMERCEARAIAPPTVDYADFLFHKDWRSKLGALLVETCGVRIVDREKENDRSHAG